MCCYNAQIFFWCHVQFHQRPSVQYNIVIWIKDYVKLRGDGWKQMDKWSSGHTFSPTYTPWQKLSRSLRWKSQTKILKSHFCLSLTNSTSIHFFVFSPPPFFLFLSLSLSSPCIVSLIGRQTACKCSNPEKSPGALVIGCALQHCSQSIKARWAPVNSFSLLLLWLWYRHTDSNFALNPSTAVLSFSLCLFHVFSLNFYLHFQSPRLPPPQLYWPSKTFLITLTPGLCYPPTLEFLLLSHLEPLLPSLTLCCHLKFHSQFSAQGKSSKDRQNWR